MINAEVEGSVTVGFAETEAAGVVLFCCAEVDVKVSPSLLGLFPAEDFFFFVIAWGDSPLNCTADFFLIGLQDSIQINCQETLP